MKMIFLSLLISLEALAVELTFVGPCSEEFIMKTKVTDEYIHVGDLTIATLKKFQIPFQGSPEGIASVLGYGNYMENISTNEFRAYGWCYMVDGIIPEVFPHEAYLTSETKSITWIYGHSHFKNGEWPTQCSEAFKIKPKELCEKVDHPNQL